MHIHRGRLLRRAAYALIVVAACVAAVVPIGGVGAFREAAEPWRSAFQERPRVQASKKVIVVMAFPSLADRLRTAPTPPAEATQRRWVDDAEQSQRALVATTALHTRALARSGHPRAHAPPSPLVPSTVGRRSGAPASAS